MVHVWERMGFVVPDILEMDFYYIYATYRSLCTTPSILTKMQHLSYVEP